MGILNVTPDSFSDGGRFAGVDDAVAAGLAMAGDGAAIIDVGGESTRPGAKPVAMADERARVIPVVARLVRAGVRVSVDTRNAAVMAAAFAAGAWGINDVSGLTHDPDSLAIVARAGCPVVLMHMTGTPDTMQLAPAYDDVVANVHGWLRERAAACVAAGVAAANIIVDPGIGFGKTLAHNLSLLRALEALVASGHPVLLGASRKGLIARLSPGDPGPLARLPGSLALAIRAAQAGCAIVRVHDVAATAQTLAVWRAIAP